MVADRHNQGKTEYSLIDYKSLEPLARVLTFGKQKYSRGNWQQGLDQIEILDSLQRHCGELIDKVNANQPEVDDESGEHIIGHIMANCMFYLYHQRNKSFTNKTIK